MPSEGLFDALTPGGFGPEVGALMSTRAGGVSEAPFASLNLRPPGLRGDALDDPRAVAENQRRFTAALEGAAPIYLDQVHGAHVVRLRRGDDVGGLPRGDASVTCDPGVACTVLVADCLPVLFSAPGGRAVAAAHAGWRGLGGGVLEAALAALCEMGGCDPADVRAWLGPCIGPDRFEVGEDVCDAFGSATAGMFRPTGRVGKWWGDLPGLARHRLAICGVQAVTGGQWCTHSEPSRFYSFRRDGITGRHAAAIWIR